MIFKLTNIGLLLAITFFLTNCSTQKKNTLVDDYNKQKNETYYNVAPYGSTLLPGKWKKTRYHTESKKQFFKNKSSVEISVEFERIDNYKFNMNGSQTGYDFVKAHYDFDSTYYADSLKLKTQVIEYDTSNIFMIYEVYGQNDNGYWDVYFLCGEKKGINSVFSVTSTRKWSKNKKIRFLKNLFLTTE